MKDRDSDFTATLHPGVRGTSSAFVMPPGPPEYFGLKGLTEVSGTIDGHFFHSSYATVGGTAMKYDGVRPETLAVLVESSWFEHLSVLRSHRHGVDGEFDAVARDEHDDLEQVALSVWTDDAQIALRNFIRGHFRTKWCWGIDPPGGHRRWAHGVAPQAHAS